MASTYIERTFGSTTNRRTFTYSVWVKRGADNAEHNILSAGNFSGNPYLDARFNANGTIEWYHYTTGYQFRLTTNRQFKDLSGWYHLVFATDTTQSTQSNRCKLYVNGVQETSFSNETYPSQDYDLAVNYSGYKTSFGSLRTNATFDGSMSHIHFIDGTAYTPSAFGSTDATTGEWKINTSPSVTYGTNGFFVLKDGNSVTDQSGNSNNLTVAGGTLTKTEDCPSNVFATMNPLSNTISTPSFSQGNNTVTPNAAAYQNAFSTLGMYGSGKYYWEIKLNGSPNSANYFGIAGLPEVDYLQKNLNVVGTTDKAFSIAMPSGDKRTNGTNSSYGSGFANGDIMMGALDLDNGKVWWGKNGTWFNSGNPASGSNEAFSVNTSYTYLIASGVYTGGYSSANHNFGNGYFGTTAVSSAGTNASNNGIFEYDVPTGYTALSTKGLNE
jgi:hypothetical protein